MTENPSQEKSANFSMRGILISIVVNAVIPFGLYTLSKQYISSSEVVALSIAALFPLVDSAFEIIRHRSLDILAVLALLGIIVSLIGIALGGDPKILLIRESFLTFGLGVACLVSLFLPRPMMFYFGRQFMAGKDPVKRAAFDAEWYMPGAPRVHRLITSIWAVAYIGEFIIRVIMVYTLPAAIVLLVSPFLLGGITVAAIVWTFSYVRQMRKRAEFLKQQRMAATAQA